MNIQGIGGMSREQLTCEVRSGARFVLYTYTVSILVLTFRRPSDVFFIRPGESRVMKGLPYTLTTFLLGWWGIPWGPIYSTMSLVTNLGGGKDVTDAIVASMSQT